MKQNKKLWFRAKTYGYGWTPASWQGWVTLILYLLANITVFHSIDMDSHSTSDTLFSFAIQFLSLTALMFILCFLTGEKPRWRWGKDKNK